MKTKEREHHITHEFFRLRNRINEPNKQRNLKTEVAFDMKLSSENEKHFFAKIIHHSENSKLILCVKKESLWYPGEFSGLLIFEQFAADMLNGLTHKQFKSELVRTLAIRIKSFALRDTG